jgi:hypothetical protein
VYRRVSTPVNRAAVGPLSLRFCLDERRHHPGTREPDPAALYFGRVLPAGRIEAV